MKQQIIKRNTQGEVIGVSEYGKEQPEALVCPKCNEPQDMLLGEEESLACEICYIKPTKPKERTEVVMPVGDEDIVGQIKGDVPKTQTAEELLVSLGVKKNEEI